MDAIETVLADLNTSLELLDSNIEAKKRRKAELKPYVEENATCNKAIGELKTERRHIKSHIDFFIGKFKSINGGAFPDKMYPLFAQADGTKQTEAV